MLLRSVVILGALLALAPACDRSTASHPMLPTTLAPGWSTPGAVSYAPDKLWQYNNGAAEKYIAQRLVRMETGSYRQQGGPQVVVELYRMAAPKGAEALFEADRPDPTLDAGIGTASQLNSYSLSYWSGHCYGRLVAPPDSADARAALLELGRALADLDQACGGG